MSERIERVIVTGGGSGIGFDVARRFLAEGSSVVLNGRDKARLERAAAALNAHDRVAIVAGSIAERGTARRLVEAAQERFGGVDVLVNNAGIFGAKPFLETSEADFDRFYATNLKGTYFVTQAAVPALIEAGGGAIVNVGTVLVEQAMTNLPISAAMASKGGVHALTVSLAAELAQHRIRVNTVAPGIIRTPLFEGGDPDAFAAIHPLGRIGEVAEISEAVLYLARSGFVTGTVLTVDGGYAHGRPTQ
jgi:NAD(P)-dependent dehydrogenase (short-subunit alcohol dehydrogenase family)